METNPAILAARAKLRAKVGDVRTGGKGSVRRVKATVHKAAAADDKRLMQSLKRMGCNQIPGIEEVNLFLNNGEVIHFESPKVQASIQSNTYVVSGTAATKKLQDLLPGIISQLGPDNLQNLKKIAESLGAAQGKNGDDDDVPDLVENFDDVASA